MGQDSHTNDRINTVACYVQEVLRDYEALGRPQAVWYRGHMREDWKLVPSVMRGTYSRERENTLLQLFRSRVRLYSPDVNREHTDELLFLAQHNDLPTRVLDWTESALAALFFALEEIPRHKHHCNEWCGSEAICHKQSAPVVWRLLPGHLNKLSTRCSRFPLPWHDNKHYEKRRVEVAHPNIRGAWEGEGRAFDLPVAYFGAYVHERVRLQSGCFTVHGELLEDMYDLVLKAHGLDNGNNCLRRFPIAGDAERIVTMLDDLRLLGVSRSRLFPEMEHMGRDLGEQFRP